jgi:sulfur-carrier protein
LSVRVLLSSSLRRYVPEYDPSSGVDLEVDEGMSVAEVCRFMNVPEEKIKIVMVDGRHRSLEHILEGDERVALFPPVGGG